MVELEEKNIRYRSEIELKRNKIRERERIVICKENKKRIKKYRNENREKER